MRALACAFALALCAPAAGQDLLNGFLIGPDATRESHEGDAQVREAVTERDWVVFANLHPTKRRYENLDKAQRKAYRAQARELVKAYWLRGAMDDPLRAFEALSQPHIFQRAVERDPCGKSADACPTRKESDEDLVGEEMGDLTGWLLATPPGERLIPVPWEEQLTFREGLKSPHVGLGQQRIGFASTSEELVRDRVHRYFKWGKYKDEETWRQKLLGLKKSMEDRLPPQKVVMATLILLQKKTDDRVENRTGDRTAYKKKNELYRAVQSSAGANAQIEPMLELVIEGEVLAARIARGDFAGSDTPGRNQMSGLSLVIAGAAVGYLEAPAAPTLARVGGVGVMGARVTPAAR